MTQYTTTSMVLNTGCKLTPMMKQYFDIKKKYMETIVFFRMGDFYECFFEDAVAISTLLNIALTHRGKIGELTIPMAGIPHHAASHYIDKVTAVGKKVAIAEQVEKPSEATGIVKRAVTQIASPGIPYNLDKNDLKERSFITSTFIKEGLFFITTIDFTVGDFLGFVTQDKDDFLEKIRLHCPKEIITHMGQFESCKEMDSLLTHYQILPTYLSEDYFDPKLSSHHIESLIPGYQRDETIKLHPGIIAPLCALSYYICSTQGEMSFCHIRPFKIVDEKKIMKVTLPTLVGLEILPKTKSLYKNSLLGLLDKTLCALGSRKLRDILTFALNDKDDILARQGLVDFLYTHPSTLSDIRERLSSIRDIERTLAKISRGNSNAGDILGIATAIKTYFQILGDCPSLPLGTFIAFSPEEKDAMRNIYLTIQNTINDHIGAGLDKGNLIKEGHHRERDRLALLLKNVSEKLQKFEQSYQRDTGITKLKVKFNNVMGYFIEVSKIHAPKVPSSFERRQTLVACERYTTRELRAFETEMIMARDNLEQLEKEIFNRLIENIKNLSALILRLSSNIAHMDAFSSLAYLSLREKFTKPLLCREKKIHIEGAWHPLIKESLQDKFVPHNLTLDQHRFFGLITGPNMAGKTTIMREVAIIQILAQIGSFVPAQKAELGLCDHLFSRLGASDDIIKGQSTFMVEMSEAVEITRHATADSLILLDEIGRGTSTYDGLGIAWALMEYLISNIKARTLFATHYHELINLAEDEKGAKNLTMETVNRGGQVKFLYHLIEGSAGQSFGIHVAKMAGLPTEVLARAETLVKKLEGEKHSGMFPPQKSSPPKHLKVIEESLQSLDITNTTPMEAFQKIQELKSHIEQQYSP